VSNYAGFDVLIDNNTGLVTPVAGATVKVYDVTAAAALADLTSDVNGHVAAGTYPAVAVGHVLRFRIENNAGMSGYAEQISF
jgi:hypothetical protein